MGKELEDRLQGGRTVATDEWQVDEEVRIIVVVLQILVLVVGSLQHDVLVELARVLGVVRTVLV